MGKHNAKPPTGKGLPRTGNGRTGGAKPAKTQVSMTTSTGTVLWKLTSKLFHKDGPGPLGGR
jgi:hypothetical protein